MGYPVLGYRVSPRQISDMRRRELKSKREALQIALRNARVDAGLTQTELARRLRRPQSFVSKYENGERRLDVIDLQEVCRAIGIPASRILRKLPENL